MVKMTATIRLPGRTGENIVLLLLLFYKINPLQRQDHSKSCQIQEKQIERERENLSFEKMYFFTSYLSIYLLIHVCIRG